MDRRGFLAGSAALVLFGRFPLAEAPVPIEAPPVFVASSIVGTTGNLETLNSMLKKYYMAPVVRQLNNDVLLMSRLDNDVLWLNRR